MKSEKSHIPTDNPNLPSFEHPFYAKQKEIWEYLEDVYEGSTRWAVNAKIHCPEKARQYLLQEESEDYKTYLGRLVRSRFDRVFRRAIEQDFSGLLTLFKTEELLPSIEDNINNIDLQNNSLTTFLKKADQKALTKGCCYVLVEAPVFDPNIVTEYDLQESNRHPYLVLIDREQVINWGYVNENGYPTIDFVVIKEYLKRRVGLFGSEDYEQYRLLRRGSYEIYEVVEIPNSANNEDRYRAVLTSSGTTSLNSIPLICYSLHDPNMVCEPPLIDLADMNVEYYRLHSSLMEIIRRCNLPTLIINDLVPSPLLQGIHAQDPQQAKEKISLGPTDYLRNVDAKFLEPTGSAIPTTISYEKQLEEAMLQKTLGFLEGNAVPKTATEALLDSAQTTSNLRGLAINKESCVESIFRVWAMYENAEEGGEIELDKSFLKPPLTWSISDVLTAITQGIISRELGLTILEEQGLLSEDQLESELEMMGGSTLESEKSEPESEGKNDNESPDDMETQDQEMETMMSENED